MKLESFLRSSFDLKPQRSGSTGRAVRPKPEGSGKHKQDFINSEGQRNIISILPSLSLPGRLRKIGPSARMDPGDGGPKDIEPALRTFVSSSPKLSGNIKIGANMNVVGDYQANLSIRRKLTGLLGPYQKQYHREEIEDPVKALLSSSHHRSRTPDSRLTKSLNVSADTGARIAAPTRLEQTIKLSQPRTQYLFSSPLQVLEKRRPVVEKSLTATNGQELIEELKHRTDALANNEPMLDCFIRMKKAGFLSREPPTEAVTPATYTRMTAEVPLHRIAKNGYMRNRFGIPYQK
jgi:hypothetical protein